MRPNRSGDSRAVMVSDETTHEGRRTRGYIARSTMNFSSQILFRFYNRDHGGIDGADVVSWGQHDLQSPNARGYGDHIADFRELIDIHGVVSLAGQSGNASPNVPGSSLNFLQSKHFDLTLAGQLRDGLEVQLLIRRDYSQVDFVSIAADRKCLEELLGW